MTDDMLSIGQRIWERDPTVLAAYFSASYADVPFVPDFRNYALAGSVSWPSLGRETVNTEQEIAEQAQICIDVLAPFVRAHPSAPVEALYRHAAARGAHAGDPGGFAALPDGRRASYTIFRTVLLGLDGIVAEAERRDASQNPQLPPAVFVPADERALTPSGQADAPASYAGEQRTVRIIPGTGELPNATTAPRPGPTPPPIEDNLQRPGTFLPPAATPAPSPASPAAGTSPEPGHGYDPTVPFNPTGAPLPGQAPAPAAETIGAGSTIAAAPAAPSPAPDAPTNPPAQDEETPREADAETADEPGAAPAEPAGENADPRVPQAVERPDGQGDLAGADRPNSRRRRPSKADA